MRITLVTCFLTVLASASLPSLSESLHSPTSGYHALLGRQEVDDPRPWILALSVNASSTRNVNGLSSPPPSCYGYPDSINPTVIRRYAFASSVNLTCWTNQPRYRPYVACANRCIPQYEAIWFKTSDNCWLPDWDISVPFTGTELARQLSDLLIYCPHTLRQASALRASYAGQTYCYSCPSLACTAQDFTPVNGGANLQCWISAEQVRGDTTWWQVKTSADATGTCWLPNQVFDPMAFNGNAHECGV